MSCPTKETEAAVRAGAEYVAYRKTIDFESRAVATFAKLVTKRPKFDASLRSR